MRSCDSCGGQNVDAHSFRVCPKCLFGEALSAGAAVAVPSPAADDAPIAPPPGFSRLSPRKGFFHKYDVLERKAQGGQGDILIVWDAELRRSVAMKRLSGHSLDSEPALHRFLAEAQITSQLQHPGILPIFDLGLDPDGKPFYTTQLLLPGTTLEEIWKKVGGSEENWTVQRALELLIRVCEVMAHAHSRGVIHRDLKPPNVLVGPFGDVRVIDWGSAHVLKEARKNFEEPLVRLDRNVQTDRGDALRADPGSPQATAQSGLPITVLFTPPEILAGHADELGPRTDVYAIGVMIYELLAGRPPYSNPDGSLPNPEELKARILQSPPIPVRSLNRSVSRDFAAICRKAMAYSKSERYESMQALADDIRNGLEIRPVHARPGLFLVLQKWAARNLGYVLLGGMMVLGASVGFSVNQGLKSQRDLARRFAEVSEALGQAELAARNGQWRAALEGWARAEAAGFRDPVYLGLHKAEAWTVLSQPERARAELMKLARRADLGGQRGVVLLRLGEHELFGYSAHEQGVEHVRQALASGLEGAELTFANGLLAESTPQALAFFRQTLQLNPFHHGAHRHSLGLEHLLGRRGELAEHIRVFETLFPDDPSAAFIAASELALSGDLAEAEARLESVSGIADPGLVNRLRPGLRLLALGAEYYDVEVHLGARSFDQSEFDRLFADASSLLAASGLPGEPFSPANFRVPYLPCVQTGVHEAISAVQALLMPLWGDMDSTIEKIKSSWRRHPEALLPMFAGSVLDARHPPEGDKSLSLLAIQADLFQMAADSPSVLPSLARTARYRAARTHFELAGRRPSSPDAAREACLANIRAASQTAELSGAEGRAYFEMAFSLGDYELARDVLKPWERRQPGPEALRARIQLKIARGAFGTALERIDEWLAVRPEDAWAIEQKRFIVKTLNGLLESARPANHPKP
jgi:serine/threonine protein kinase